MDEHNIDHIDFLQINCEGGEYALMNYILKNNLDKVISHIAVQYHQDSVNTKYSPVAHYQPEAHQIAQFVERGFKHLTNQWMWCNLKK